MTEPSHPRLMADSADILKARVWMREHEWYRKIIEKHKSEIDKFLTHRPIYVSPVKQTYQYKMYNCPKHDVELLYEEFSPHVHRCPIDTTEKYSGPTYESAWSGWYNRRLAEHLVWMGILYQLYGEEKYADGGKEILLKFADLYLKYPTENTILGPAHVFFGTLSESFWGVDMAYGYDLLFNYRGFNEENRQALKEKLFYPLAEITQKFPESASNRQLWYNNVSAAVGFLYGDQKLIDFALKGEYGFEWQLGSALPESGFWAEWSGYHFVTLRGMIHLAEMTRHNGLDLYHKEIAGRSMKKMFDAPFELIFPNFEFPRCKDSGGGNILEYAAFWEVGYAVYRDPKYLALLNMTKQSRGRQVVGETSALGEAEAPVTMFNLDPNPPEYETDIYPDSSVDLRGNGFAVLRNGKEKDRRYLYLDYGIMGGEHGHPDRLQIGYYADGRHWIVDPLNESYFNPNLQLWFRQTIAHNTPVVNQTTQTWTNGCGIFFGALPGFQTAAGATETAYPGAKLTRTLLQVEDYFIDIVDMAAQEKRMIDWPLHSFGKLKVGGVNLKPEPPDLFGAPHGIPGYDQLTEIYSGKTDGAWTGVFTTEDNRHLLVSAVAEPGTEVFQAITPPIGGFYKQMVKEQKPLPMVFSRRVADTTRFVHLIQAYEKVPSVVSIQKASTPNSYLVRRIRGEDLLHADIARSQYWVLRTENQSPAMLSSFGAKEIKIGDIIYLSGDFPLSEFECRWAKDELSVVVPRPYGRLKIWGPNVGTVQVNRERVAFEKDGSYIIIKDPAVAMEIAAPNDSTIFLGMNNRFTMRVWNRTERPINGKISLSAASDWEERVQSQLAWWGGIVNLKALNKGSIQRRTFPEKVRADASWLDGKSSESKTIQPGSSETFALQLQVPNDVAPADYPVVVSFGVEKLKLSIAVKAPISVELMLPDGEKEVLWVDLKNQTKDFLNATMQLLPHPAWKLGERFPGVVGLGAREVRRLKAPIKLSGYNPDNQLYPVRVKVQSGGFEHEFQRDFYVGVAHYAETPPSLDGSWSGWNRTNPVTIDKPTQICKLLFGNQPWGGPEDLSAKIYAMYDESYIYIGAEITDDVVISHWDFPVMSYPWDTDCMEVVLDTRTNSEQGHDPPTPGLFRHLSMAEVRVTDFGPKMWQGGGAGGPLLPKPNLVLGAETYFQKTKVGYNMICRYPLSGMVGVIAKPGYKIGFDVAINDNDGTNYRKNMHIWAGYTQNQTWWDMGTIGVLIFGEKH